MFSERLKNRTFEDVCRIYGENKVSSGIYACSPFEVPIGLAPNEGWTVCINFAREFAEILDSNKHKHDAVFELMNGYFLRAGRPYVSSDYNTRMIVPLYIIHEDQETHDVNMDNVKKNQLFNKTFYIHLRTRCEIVNEGSFLNKRKGSGGLVDIAVLEWPESETYGSTGWEQSGLILRSRQDDWLNASYYHVWEGFKQAIMFIKGNGALNHLNFSTPYQT
ncbi:hypothetical protein ACFJZ3_004142 [Vibrio vulnificus]